MSLIDLCENWIVDMLRKGLEKSRRRQRDVICSRLKMAKEKKGRNRNGTLFFGDVDRYS